MSESSLEPGFFGLIPGESWINKSHISLCVATKASAMFLRGFPVNKFGWFPLDFIPEAMFRGRPADVVCDHLIDKSHRLACMAQKSSKLVTISA